MSRGDPVLVGTDDARRADVVRLGHGGLDYVDVGETGRTLVVAFFGAVPAELTHRNFTIEGGVRVRDIRVLSARVRASEPGAERSVTLRVDRAGDFSRYTLRVVDVPRVDPRYAALDFTFGTAGGAPDCGPVPQPAPPAPPQPQIDYLAKDYASMRRLLLDRASLIVPAWAERRVPDIGVTLAELLAYVGDYLSYYQDAVATEAYLQTARKRVSVRRHARLVDYAVHEGCNARAWVAVTTPADVGPLHPRDVAFATEDPAGDAAGGETFAPLGTEALTFYAAQSRMALYAWGNHACSIPRGATRATLSDAWEPAAAGADEPPARALRHLAAGAFVVFEELLDPRTGATGDADPAHRHAVRLTHVRRDVDPLYDLPIVEIAWDVADRLPFELCVSAPDPHRPAAPPLAVSVAWGNVVLADHGRTVPAEDLAPVPPAGSALPYRPALAQAGLAFREPVAQRAPAAALGVRDPRAAVAQVLELRTVDPDRRERTWSVRPDLLASGPEDAHYVVEVDDDGRAGLRFGDGRLGRAPEPGSAVRARYRVGGGPAGNVGAGAIDHVVVAGPVAAAELSVCNPLPAVGGTAPESIEDVKALAPSAIRARPERALTADDYARIAARDPRLQGAAAALRWTGSRTVVRVALDPLGTEQLDPALAGDVAAALSVVRRIGHDVEVVAATYVPLHVALQVVVAEGYRRRAVETAVRDVLGDGVTSTGELGFFHPDALSFGQGIAQSRLVTRVLAVTGVETVSVERLERLFAPVTGAPPAVLALGPLEIPQLHGDPDRTEDGLLRITVAGGR